MWISWVGGKLKVYSGSQELQSASEKRVPSPRIQSAPLHLSLMNLVPQKPVMPRISGWSSGKGPLAHQGVGDGELQVLGERAQFGHGVGPHDPPADVEQRASWPSRSVLTIRSAVASSRDGLAICPGVRQHPLEQRRIDLLGENVHGHIDQHRAGAPALGEDERLLEDLREKLGRVHAPGALDEGPVDLHCEASACRLTSWWGSSRSSGSARRRRSPPWEWSPGRRWPPRWRRSSGRGSRCVNSTEALRVARA